MSNITLGIMRNAHGHLDTLWLAIRHRKKTGKEVIAYFETIYGIHKVPIGFIAVPG